MDLTWELLSIQNPWWRGGSTKFDPVLRQYDGQKLKWRPEVLDKLDLNKDEIYRLNGSRGAGKTTILKLTVRRLLEEDKIEPRQIFYYSCQNLDSFEQLNEMIKLFLSLADKKKRAYLLLDEISSLPSWQKGLDLLKRAGKFKKATVILASSFLEKDGKSPCPAGQCLPVNGLNFSGFVRLLNPDFFKKIRLNNYHFWERKIEYYLDAYLLTGGYPAAVADFFKHGAVGQRIYSNYFYWFSAFVARLGRDPGLARQLMEKIISHLGQPVGYQTLVKKTKAKTHLTAAEYLKLLEDLFAVKTVYQSAAGRPATRSAKKVYFTDPFFFWLFYAYVHGSLDYWRLARERLHDRTIFSHLLENAVFSHLNKDAAKEIFYWRQGNREINFLIKERRTNTPVLISYDQEIKEADFKIFQSAGFKNGLIITDHRLENRPKIKIMPLSYFLLFY